MNAILGKSQGSTVVERIDQPGKEWGKRCSGEELCTMFLSGLGDDKFRDMTGLPASKSPALLFELMRRKARRFSQLLELLAKMFGSAALEARTCLRDEELFQSIVTPSNGLPQGLESAPESHRAALHACGPLMKALSEETQHYYVEGKQEITWGRGSSATKKRLISVWLVYTRNPEKSYLPYRSVRAAERGKNGDLAAVYDERLTRDSTMLSFLDVCFSLKLPNVGDCPLMDGKGRGLMDAPRRVKESVVGMYLNSAKDKTGTVSKPPNCTRLWDPDWTSFGNSKNPISVPDDARMGLVLTKDIQAYDELVYCYDWAKHENSNCCRSSSMDIYHRLSKSGGNR
jgi:hypothetical protein